MIIGIDSKIEVDLQVRADLGFRPGKLKPREPRLGEPGIEESGALAHPLCFIIVLPSCVVASLRAESLSGLLEIAEFYWGFF